MEDKGLLRLSIRPGQLCRYFDGRQETLVLGFTPNSAQGLLANYTHLGVVLDGRVILSYAGRTRLLEAGDFFSVVGPASLHSYGTGLISAVPDYRGSNLFGGPLEPEGRLRYINGCTDTLLVPPVRRGDPCLNHLHFPPHTVQTPHTHPSVRVNVVYKGSGVCLVPEDERSEVPLVPGYAFIMKTETLHSFNTGSASMDIITFHPDSDVGVTDDDHPMVNRTMVEGTSARYIEEIRT